jgi:hypothetical protein
LRKTPFHATANERKAATAEPAAATADHWIASIKVWQTHPYLLMLSRRELASPLRAVPGQVLP